jgi:hypothetical protein
MIRDILQRSLQSVYSDQNDWKGRTDLDIYPDTCSLVASPRKENQLTSFRCVSFGFSIPGCQYSLPEMTEDDSPPIAQHENVTSKIGVKFSRKRYPMTHVSCQIQLPPLEIRKKELTRIRMKDHHCRSGFRKLQSDERKDPPS